MYYLAITARMCQVYLVFQHTWYFLVLLAPYDVLHHLVQWWKTSLWYLLYPGIFQSEEAGIKVCTWAHPQYLVLLGTSWYFCHHDDLVHCDYRTSLTYWNLVYSRMRKLVFKCLGFTGTFTILCTFWYNDISIFKKKNISRKGEGQRAGCKSKTIKV